MREFEINIFFNIL